MANPVRPDGDIVDAGGKITPRWNIWFSWVDTFVGNGRTYGTTAQRPVKNVYIGQFYYDTTLGYPVYVDSVGPIVWHDGAGAVA
jgi:hypothetical protein